MLRLSSSFSLKPSKKSPRPQNFPLTFEIYLNDGLCIFSRRDSEGPEFNVSLHRGISESPSNESLCIEDSVVFFAELTPSWLVLWHGAGLGPVG